jgi:hypothetical protein
MNIIKPFVVSEPVMSLSKQTMNEVIDRLRANDISCELTWEPIRS